MKKITIKLLLGITVLMIGPIALSQSDIGHFSSVSDTNYWGDSRAFLFKNGRILLVRGSKDEYWDPKLQKWLPAERGFGKEKVPSSISDDFLEPEARYNQIVITTMGRYRDSPATIRVWDSLTGKWYFGPVLITPRKKPTTTRLSNGTVLIAGGGVLHNVRLRGSVLSNEIPSNAVEIFDGKTVKQTAPLNQARIIHSATLLSNGNVLVAGGVIKRKESIVVDRRIKWAKTIKTVEQYNVQTKTWEVMAPMNVERYGHASIRRKDGKVMVIGGYQLGYVPIDSVEIWDPTTNTWETGPSLPMALSVPKAKMLSDGNILVSGSNPDGPNIYYLDTTTMQWHATNSREKHMARSSIIALKNKDALVFSNQRTAFHWSPTGGTSSKLATGYIPRKDPALIVLKDKRLLVAGGGTLNVQAWNPVVEFWDNGGSLNTLIKRIRAVELPDGRIMVVGLDKDYKPVCELGSLVTKTWSGCPNFPSLPEISDRWTGQPTISMLNEKITIVMLDTAQALLWDVKAEAWHVVNVGDGHKDRKATNIKAVGQLRIGEGPNHYSLLDKSGKGQADVSVYAMPTEGRNAAVLLKDGRSFFVLRRSGGGSTSHMLFDGNNKWYHYAKFNSKVVLGDSLVETKDGCVLSWSSKNYATPPVSIINPDTLIPTPIYEAVGVRDAAMVVHNDGKTVTFAGTDKVAEQGGSGIRQFKASCKGLVPLHKKVAVMPGASHTIAAEDITASPSRNISFKGFFTFSFSTVLMGVMFLLVIGIFIFIIRLARR